jgi:DNA-directed RNA polymerase subunit RPC12/RpoP/uncharacterized membrane protein YuzA (DUF378 family)
MIRFKCIYCGKRIVARDDVVGKKGKCPKCQHLLLIPRTTKGRPAISIDTPRPQHNYSVPAKQTNAPPCDDNSIENYRDEDLADVYAEKRGFFIPIYDELSLFTMSVALILLAIGNSRMREQLWRFASATDDWSFGFWIVIAIAGLCVCLYHPFTKKEKHPAEKMLMLAFAVLANGATGILAGTYMLKHTSGWLLIFPLWNIINGLILLAMFRFDIIDESCISDRDATMAQVIVGLTSVFILFILCNFVFKLYWAITFSICIVYSTSFDKAIQTVLPGLTDSGPGAIS